jgi:glyoxylase-like metal-dependent hydrolase (beta-lactamase superfamily II)
MPMDYFIWLVRSPEHTFVIDLGFNAEVAAQRKRDYLRTPKEGLALLGVDADQVEQVIVTHLHYDHVGTFADFPRAQFHLQDAEMAYATGRHMRHGCFSHGFEVEDVVGMVRLVYKERVTFHKGEAQLAPGLSVHLVGGHTDGLQCVRVWTQRGWVVLASDVSHYYEHFETYRAFPTMFNIGDALEGYDTLRRLADSTHHIIPGHDPLVLQRYPAPSPELQGIVARLDVAPTAD